MAAAGGCGVKTGGHVEKDFGRSGGAVATGIRQAWQGAREGRRSQSRAVMG